MKRHWLTVLVFLVLGAAAALAHDGWLPTVPAGRDTLWGEPVLVKIPEANQELGGGFRFRSVGYYMACRGRCFENPWHIGELWYGSRLLGRGLSEPDDCCSLSPSRRVLLFRDEKLRLFDRDTGRIQDLSAENPSAPDIRNCKWNEKAQVVALPYSKDLKPTVVELPN